MKLNKIFALAISCALVAGVLVGCGGGDSQTESNSGSSQAETNSGDSSAASQTADVKAAADAVLAANPMSDVLPIDDNIVSLELGLAEDSYTAYAGATARDQNDSGRVIVIAYAEGQEKAVTDALEAYRQAQVTFFGNYPEFADAQARLENDYALVSGNGIAILAVASNECSDVSAMTAAAEKLVK